MNQCTSVYLLLLILLIIWVFWYCSNKSNMYQGASMAGVFTGPMSYGPQGGSISGSSVGHDGSLVQLNQLLHGAPQPM